MWHRTFEQKCGGQGPHAARKIDCGTIIPILHTENNYHK